MDHFLPSWLNPRVVYVLLGLGIYSSVCQVLRFRRLKDLERRFRYDGTGKERPLSNMTTDEAWEIQKGVSDGDFPALFEKGLQLALFRTYGIPTIAKLLNQTCQLSKFENVGKRYADTAVIITEMYENYPTEKRSHEAFARLNYLHGTYIKAGRISNDDMLYTLGLFMNHPVEWINRYEWRKLTPMEVCALAASHKEIGTRMHISYDVLPSSKTGWKDGLHFYEELDTWCKQYEAKNLIPNQESHRLALMTKDIFLSTVPSFMHSAITQFISSVMDDRLRESIMFEPAHPLVVKGLDAFMMIRRFYLRWFALPKYNAIRNLSKEESPEGRRWVQIYGITPHYVKPTLWERWGPTGLFQLMIGSPRAGDEGMCPEGYLRSNIGPKSFDGKGQEEFKKEMEFLGKARKGMCPFPGVKS